MVYLDTSVVVPLFVPEPASRDILDWIASCSDRIASSDWLLPEYSNALRIKVRAREITARQARSAERAFADFCQGGLLLAAVSRPAFAAAARLAGHPAGAFRGADALHLAMAREMGATMLATADASLARGAESQGVPVKRF
jgi:predicted nucleic acid-binding protein